MVRRTWIPAAAVVAGLSTAVVTNLQAATPPADEQKLLAVVQSDAPFFDKAKACQQLAVVGTKRAVPVLAALLSNERLAHYARFGLEPIPDPSVDAALREALATLKGSLLVGVINSIGVRRDAEALGQLTTLMGDADPAVAAAAAAAAGTIGTVEAAGVLRTRLGEASGDRRPPPARACLSCAESLLKQGKRTEAIALYDAVRNVELPRHIQLSALRGAIIARQEKGVPLLLEKLQGKDAAAFTLALSVARELSGSTVTRRLVKALNSLPAKKRALVIQALGDRGEAEALPALLKAAAKGAQEIRVAAIRALKGIGDASAVPVLIDAATQTEGAVAETAKATLAQLHGTAVDTALVAQLDRVQTSARPVVIELVGRRGIAAAVPALRKLSEDQNDATRLAAIKALGSTIGPDDLTFLTGRFLAAKEPADKAALLEALKNACRRAPDPQASTQTLFASMAQASLAGKSRLLEVFSFIGGAKALSVVSAAAGEGEEELRIAAYRVLGTWPSEDAVPELLRLTAAAKTKENRTRALNAFATLVPRLGSSNQQKLAWCQEAMRAAPGDEERKPVLAALGSIPAPRALRLAMQYVDDPILGEDACAAAVAIAERIVRRQPKPVAQAMKQVLQFTRNTERAGQARRILRRAGGK